MLRYLTRKAFPALLVTASISASSALSATLPMRPILTLNEARTVAAAAEAKARSEGWPCVVAVVDGEGLPIVLERMDNASVLAGVELAPGKARTAALFRRESGALKTRSTGTAPLPSPPAASSFAGRNSAPRRWPCHWRDRMSLPTLPDHDEQIARAGAAALAK